MGFYPKGCRFEPYLEHISFAALPVAQSARRGR